LRVEERELLRAVGGERLLQGLNRDVARRAVPLEHLERALHLAAKAVPWAELVSSEDAASRVKVCRQGRWGEESIRRVLRQWWAVRGVPAPEYSWSSLSSTSRQQTLWQQRSRVSDGGRAVFRKVQRKGSQRQAGIRGRAHRQNRPLHCHLHQSLSP